MGHNTSTEVQPVLRSFERVSDVGGQRWARKNAEYVGFTTFSGVSRGRSSAGTATAGGRFARFAGGAGVPSPGPEVVSPLCVVILFAGWLD